MYSQRYKYPRTPHLSFSPGVGFDDLKLDRDREAYPKGNRLFVDCQIVVTEKLDGQRDPALKSAPPTVGKPDRELEFADVAFGNGEPA